MSNKNDSLKYTHHGSVSRHGRSIFHDGLMNVLKVMVLGCSLHSTGYAGNIVGKFLPLPTRGNGAVGSTATVEKFTFQGVKFNDLNGNGVRDINEKGIAFEKILIRNDDLVSKGLPGDYTATTDIQGQYSISGLVPGHYTIRTTVGKTFWQTAPIKATKRGDVVPYEFNTPNSGVNKQIDFGVWDGGVVRQECTLCAITNDQQTDMGEETSVGGTVQDKAPDGSDLTITVEAFGFSTVKVIPAAERTTEKSIPAMLSIVFPRAGNYSVKITAKSIGGQVAEETGKIIVRDVATSDACDITAQNVWSTRSGNWDDPTTWTGGRVPQAKDWVMIRASHEVRSPALSTAQMMKKEAFKIKGLCIDQNAKLGHFFYKTWKTQPLGLTDHYITPNVRSAFREARRSDACEVAITKTAKKLQPPGRWDDADTWESVGIPEAMDSVHIPADVAVVVPYSTAITVDKIESLCNEGLLMSPTELPPDNQQYWLAVRPNSLHNKGTIVSNNGVSGGPGVGISLGTPNEFDNDGSIQSGNGGDAGDGGAIRVDPNNFTNNGLIQLGSGGYCDAHMGWCPRAGNGGNLNINATGEVTVKGMIQGGNGGNAGGVHGSVKAGTASQITINGDPKVVTGAVIMGQNGVYHEDPIQLKLESEANIHSGEIYFVSDENGKIEVGPLSEGAITAERTLTWAIGKGGVIDFSQVSDKAFRAGQEVIIHADNILLPAGKTLDQLVDAPKLTVGPAKLLARASWLSNNETILGQPGESILLPLTLNNLGPATDTYHLTLTTEQNWSLCKLPQTVTVNSQRRVELECQVVLPQTYDAENLLTVTATSETDPLLQITSQLHVKVKPKQDVLQFPSAEDAVTIQDSQWTVISKNDEVKTFPFSTTPNLSSDQIRMTLGSNLTTDGQPNIIDINIQSDNNDIILTSPQDGDLEPLIIDQEGKLLVKKDTVEIAFDSEGGWVGTDSKNPQYQVAMTPNGEIVATDNTLPHFVVSKNKDGSFTGKDLVSGTQVTIDEQDQKIVTHPDFPGMQAIVNSDETLTVTDNLDPEVTDIAVIFNLKTGQYQVVNTVDGTCYDESIHQRKSFLKNVAGFISKAAGFVAKVATAITPVTNFIGKIAGTVNGIIGKVLNIAPTINKWATKILGWACNNCHPFIANIANFFAKATIANGGFLGFLGAVQTVSKVIVTVTNAIPKVATIAQKVSDWFAKFKAGKRTQRKSERTTCEEWYPITETTSSLSASCLLYGVQDQALNDSILFAYDPNEKTTKKIGEVCPGCDIESLAIHPMTNEIYVGSGDDAVGHPKGHLYKVNPITGELHSIGDTGFSGISSLAFDDQGTLWAWAKGQGLVTLDINVAQGELKFASLLELADLSWDTMQKVLYGVVGKELWSYSPTTNEVNKVCENLPVKTEAIRVLPSQFLPEGMVLLGAHENKQLTLQVFDLASCQPVTNLDIFTGYGDVEGLAMPVEACQ